VCVIFVYLLMPTVTRFVFSSSCPYDAPNYIYLFCYPEGKVRVHKRGKYHRIDRWFQSFDDVAPLISRLYDTGYYDLAPSHTCVPIDYWYRFSLADELTAVPA